ncbi:MAG TPA: sulfite exporter TauE/SafE family protein [Bryobacteraceae bacterium]|jgi:hypothetical protein|nr:sulfite exporter TauE/SafE family protein [Bryobacteraceae bacterium]
MLLVWIIVAAVLGAGVAAVAGFGIGTILTPVVAFKTGMKLAFSVVALPHFVATLIRSLKLWRHLDWRVFWTFGVMNAAGALIGALLHGAANNSGLKWLLAALLSFAGLLSIFGYADRMRFGRALVWPGGAVSGMLGGLVGNQGGIRSAAMLGLNVDREAFVATGIGLIVDVGRIPVYLYSDADMLLKLGPTVLWATLACVVGTLLGAQMLCHSPKPVFRRVIGAVLLFTAVMLMVQRSK